MANATVQTEPLKDRLTPHQQSRRQARITARRTVAENLAKAIGGTNYNLLVFAHQQQHVRNLQRWIMLAALVFDALVTWALLK